MLNLEKCRIPTELINIIGALVFNANMQVCLACRYTYQVGIPIRQVHLSGRYTQHLGLPSIQVYLSLDDSNHYHFDIYSLLNYPNLILLKNVKWYIYKLVRQYQVVQLDSGNALLSEAWVLPTGDYMYPIQRALTLCGRITVPLSSIQFNLKGFDQTRKHVAICMY